MRRSARSAPAYSRGAIRLVDVELGRPLSDLRPASAEAAVGGGYQHVRILARLHGQPLGTVSLGLPPDGCLSAVQIADAIWVELAEAIGRHCAGDGQVPPRRLTAEGLVSLGEPPCSWGAAIAGVPPCATIVITTCGGEDSRLDATISAALSQTYPSLEVVVVDNRPATSGVRAAMEPALSGDDRLRYAAEPRPGLSHARNRGAAVARSEIVAFTDDDVDIDPDWLGWLVAGFDDPAVGCVTGLILPLELQTGAQLLLEEFGGYAKGFDRRVFDCDQHRPDHPLYPYTVGVFGSGANAAFRRTALADIGGFDTALGAGTLARGGEDLDIYVTCVQRGFRLVYQPNAIIRHAHLRDMTAIHQKVRDYGVGLGAMLTKHLVRDRSTFAALVSRLPAGTVHLLSNRSPKNSSRSTSYPTSLIRAELGGVLYGPIAYLRSRASS